jgi:hypothetical protein
VQLEPSIIVSAIALAGTLLGLAASRSRYRAEVRKLHAEAEASIAGVAVSVAGGLRKEIESLRRQHCEDMERLTERVQTLEERNSTYRRYIGMLMTQLTRANLTPVEPPSPWPEEY